MKMIIDVPDESVDSIKKLFDGANYTSHSDEQSCYR